MCKNKRRSPNEAGGTAQQHRRDMTMAPYEWLIEGEASHCEVTVA